MNVGTNDPGLPFQQYIVDMLTIIALVFLNGICWTSLVGGGVGRVLIVLLFFAPDLKYSLSGIVMVSTWTMYYKGFSIQYLN